MIHIPNAHPVEIAWLVENINPGPPRWLSVVEGIFHFTTDASTAIRFSRKEDAEQMTRLGRFADVVSPSIIATEHMWV